MIIVLCAKGANHGLSMSPQSNYICPLKRILFRARLARKDSSFRQTFTFSKPCARDRKLSKTGKRQIGLA